MTTDASLISNLVIGKGELGTALQRVLECDSYDLGDSFNGTYDVIHICFPYSQHFYSYVREYQEKFKPKHTVIHSTVPVGTSRKLGAIHSPIRGVHPFLEEGIRTFPKHFGGENNEEVATLFRSKGIQTVTCASSEATELMKIVDTTSYGINILIEKEIYRLCEKYGVNFHHVYTLANSEYNKGYLTLGMPQFQKYKLEHRDGKIGGHCIMPNAEMLDSWMNDLLKEQNERL